MAEKPKRPLSAYMLWLNDNREQIKRDNPGIKVTEVAKRGGELWRGLKDKSKWEQKAVEAKDKYTKLVKEYEANGGGKESGKKRGSKQTRKAPSKKTKKQADSEDDEDEDESD